MGKKNKRKDNKRHLCPPLTFLDKSIYFLCIVFSFLGVILLASGFNNIKNMIAFNKPETIAYNSNVSFWFFLPFWMFFVISTFVFFVSGWKSKKPIFGSKKYKYGEYPFRKDCIPLFHRKKYNLKKTPSQKKFARQMIILWCSLLIVFSCLLPFSLFSRIAMYEDNHIEKINLVNLTSDVYTPDDFAHLTIKTQYDSGSRYSTIGYWKYEIIIEMRNGKSFSFSNRDFERRVSSTKDICLDKMLEIKSLFDSEAITIKGANNTDDVADYLGFNESQKVKLNELFTK